MERQNALSVLEENLKNINLRKHSLASEAVLIALAKHFNQNEHNWGLAGLLHDIDYEHTADNPEKHGLMAQEILKSYNLEPEVLVAIKNHNAEMLASERLSLLDFALTCGEVVTGLIIAAGLIREDKKLSEVKVKSLKKRLKEKSFARGVNREHIMLCKECGLELDEFLEISLKSMQEIAPTLDL